MGEPASARVAVWYAAASKEAADPQPWRLWVTMTGDVEGDAREDHLVPGVDVACALLRQWYRDVTGDG